MVWAWGMETVREGEAAEGVGRGWTVPPVTSGPAVALDSSSGSPSPSWSLSSTLASPAVHT